ncbi:peroxisomal membrane protein 11C-like [Spodoptera frugiperda]|uniref:Peroxisomal membrane protein 11C-like n=1 Tax=Spodoptera frugiperda TaxID=7108 RepID=A0A9R0D5N3_SPOFR|nr:peroxisomal membrane protein 11C-like [Spodoptera frugiperda]
MAAVNELADLLQAHANRDKVVNLACYALKLWGSTAKRQDVMSASARLAAARACMRLFDDAMALKTALAYGFGTKDGSFWGTLGVAGSAFTLAYLQAEKLSFLIDTGMLHVSKDTEFKIRTAHKLFWSLSAFVGFLRSIRALNASSEALRRPDRTKCAPARFTQASLTTTKFLLDTIHAVSWLPPGWLWGSRLSVPQASGIATVSAVLGLVIHYHGKRF